MTEDVFSEAARWQAVQHRDDMDWDGFTAWLEADPRHRAAFDDLVLLDDDVARHREAVRCAVAAVEPPNAAVRPAVPRRRGWGWGAAAAASIALVGAMWTSRRPGPPASTEYRADAGPRVIALDGGVTVALATGSVLTAGAAPTGTLSIAGRALFEVRHDPGRRLTVLAAGYRIEDIGTRFEVIAGDGMVNVAVADGRVTVAAPTGGAGVNVVAGRSLTGLADGHVTTAAIGAGEIGGWRAGPLVYDGVPLGLVAADVARVSGRPVTVDPAIAGRAFSGVLSPARGDAMAEALGSIAGLRSGRDGDAITLRDRADR